MNLEGIHHVSAVTARRDACIDFYNVLLGLDRIDRRAGEPALTFGDRSGSPGSVITFAEIPGALSGRSGRGLVHRIQWRVGGRLALAFWQRRLELAGVAVEVLASPDGVTAGLRFEDSEGLGHELALDETADPPLIPARTLIPREFRLRGIGGVRAYAAASVQSSDLLAGRLGFEGTSSGDWLVRGRGRAARYGCDPPPAGRAVQGAGTVTHVAWSCRPGDERAWRQRVIGMGAVVSPILETNSCRCFYFREPDGVLFSVATGGTGGEAPRRFAVPRPADLPRRIARPVGLAMAI